MVALEDNLIYILLRTFFESDKGNIGCLLFISILSSIVQTSGMSYVTAGIINAAQTKKDVWFFYHCFVGILLLNLLIYYAYYHFQNVILTKLRPWVRLKMVESLLVVNSDIFSEANFSRMTSPIGRVADLLTSIVADVIGYFVPNAMYALISTGFFFFINPNFGIIFAAGNAINALYYYCSFGRMLQINLDYENQLLNTDAVLIDIMNNVDKIVYRGQVNEEVEIFGKMYEKDRDTGLAYFSESTTHATVMIFIVLCVILTSLAYMVYLLFAKKMSIVMFISAFSILMLYREKMTNLSEQLPGFIGYVGRIQTTLKMFSHVNQHYADILKSRSFSKEKLAFRRITFEKVTYKYSTGKTILDKKSVSIDLTNHKIIGITGPSGCGKSTLMKLLLKMYPFQEGKIFIDDQDIEFIDPTYIRKKITYVNQTSKLFDVKVIENLLYGCVDPDTCKMYLDKIMTYPHIASLFQNIDIYKKQSGLLGENLSGGQRQVINMIGGFINPSKILILDEPTNALDPSLKKEILQIIKDFKPYKQAIIIISHDKDIFPLFDDEIKM